MFASANLPPLPPYLNLRFAGIPVAALSRLVALLETSYVVVLVVFLSYVRQKLMVVFPIFIVLILVVVVVVVVVVGGDLGNAHGISIRYDILSVSLSLSLPLFGSEIFFGFV